MSRYGLIARNETTGEDTRISKRESEINLQFKSERDTLSQLPTPPNRFGGDPGGTRSDSKAVKKPVQRPNRPPQEISTDSTVSQKQGAAADVSQYNPVALNSAQPTVTPNSAPGAAGGRFPKQRDADFNLRDGSPRPPSALRHTHQEQNADAAALTSESPVTAFPQTQNGEAAVTERTDAEPAADLSDAPPQAADTRGSSHAPLLHHHGGGRFKERRDTAFQTATPTPKSEGKTPPPARKPAEAQHPTGAAQSETVQTDAPVAPQNAEQSAPAPDDTQPADAPKPADIPDTPLKQDKPGRLKFTADEAAPGDKPVSRKLAKAEKQAAQAGAKLEQARAKLPAKRKLRSERVFDVQSGKPKRQLHFEKEVKTQGQHLKGALPLRPVKAAGNSLMLNAHRKIHQVEHENVAVKAAHRAELTVEGGVRAALRFHKTAPYRKVTRLERQAANKTVKLNYQKALADNPKLSSSVFSRMWQKRKIKKDYAKAAREAKRAAQSAQKAGSVMASAAKAVAGFVRRRPITSAVVILLVILLFLFMSLFGLGVGMGNAGLGGILTGSYLADDADIDSVELSYSEWETDLQLQILNAESNHPGFDEYRYETGDISHNPLELMAYLTAVYQYFPYSDISGELRVLFDEQYSLTFTETAETRYADPDDANEDGDYEPYDWSVLTVTLDSLPFTDVIYPKMTAEQREHYDILIRTKGGRQYVGNPFDTGWLPYVSGYYGWRVHPISGAKNLHRGIDIGFPAGTEIHSVQDGTVTFAGYGGDYGNIVIIENDKGLVTKYAHCDTMLVSAGQTVTAGDAIATVGNTGASTGPHLHMEVMKDGQYLNPLFHMDTGGSDLLPVYGVPGAAMGDGSYDALIEEAEKYLGFPYVWGGSTPETSFDCSGFVCYALTQSGVKNTGRTTALGLYNLCTPVSQSDAQAGDLIFFTGTYSTPSPVTHVGIYVGGGRMLHCGNPISYTSIETSYWQSHYYSFGRLN
jgi:murein DD-endopeptidase MepM/ murein hydrolase activator NlpD